MAKLSQFPKLKKPASYEEAMTMAGYGPFHWFVLLACGGCLMSVIIETMSMMFIIPAAQCDLKLGLLEKGLLSSISFFGVVFSSHYWGFRADTKGRKNVLVFSLISSAILSFICSIVPWNWLFILLRFCNGALIGGASAVVYAYAGEFHDNLHRPKVISWIATFVAFGNMYLPGIAWLILPSEHWSVEIPVLNILFRPWRLLLIIYALPSLVFAFCIYILPESPKFLLTQGKQEEVLTILTKIFCTNTGKQDEDYLVSEILWDEFSDPHEKKPKNIFKVMWKQTVPIFKKPFLTKTIMVCFLQFGIFMTTSGLVMWFPEMLNSMAHYSKEVSDEDVALCKSVLYEEEEHMHQNVTRARICKDTVNTDVFLVSVVLGMAYALVYVFIGAVINILGKKNLLVGFTIITLISGVTSQLVYGYSLIQILVGMFLLGGAGIGVVNAIVVDLYPTQIRAMALAVSLMFGRFGAMAGSNLVGPILYNLCDYMFYIFAVDQILVIIVVLLLPSSAEIPHLTEPVI